MLQSSAWAQCLQSVRHLPPIVLENGEAAAGLNGLPGLPASAGEASAASAPWGHLEGSATTRAGLLMAAHSCSSHAGKEPGGSEKLSPPSPLLEPRSWQRGNTEAWKQILLVLGSLCRMGGAVPPLCPPDWEAPKGKRAHRCSVPVPPAV